MPRARSLVLAIPWTWLVLFLLLPTAIVLKIAVSQSIDGVPPYTPLLHWTGGTPQLRATPDNFALILTDPLYRGAFLHSLRVAGLSTLICLLLGYPMALAIARARQRWRNPLLLTLMLPFWTGFLMRINAWIGLLQDNGWINTALLFCHLSPLRLLYTDTAMYIGIVYTYLPFMVLPLYARLTRLDATLLEAAGDLGAPPWRAFVAITLPLSLPGVWAGALLVFIPAVGEYVIPELLGGPQAQLIGRVLWNEFFQNRDWPTASALACMLLVLLLIMPIGIWMAASLSLRGAQRGSNLGRAKLRSDRESARSILHRPLGPRNDRGAGLSDSSQ
ncbi:MAG TPA: ABC transporter permease subunit [Acetobacteraceae bacterium]|nr:ABC transporter permease subunit [Acetobacteraceae bacterium]